MEEADIRRFLKEKALPKYTEYSITDVDQYIQEINKVKQRGYSIDREEYHVGVRGIATLIRAKGYPITSIGVLGFTGSMTEDKLNVMSKHLLNTAQEISNRLSQ